MVNYVCTLRQSEMENYFEWIIVIVLQLTIIFHNFVAVILGQKIKDRFENLNKKKNRDMRKLFIQEGQEVPKGKPGRKRAIHPSSVIPAIPERVTDDTYEEQRKQIVTEWRKSKKNYSLLKELMSSTFPIRRWEVPTQNVRVWKIMEDFPNFAFSSGNEVQSIFSCKLEPISTVIVLGRGQVYRLYFSTTVEPL